MTYHEKRTLMTSFIGLLVTISYIIFAIISYNSGTTDSLSISFWALWILIFIGIGIIAVIVATILFHIGYSIGLAVHFKKTNPSLSDKDIEIKVNQTIKIDTAEDEMGKLIGLKSMRIGFAFAGLGFVISLIAILVYNSPIIMINIIFLFFSIGSALEGLVQLYYYKRGIHHA